MRNNYPLFGSYLEKKIIIKVLSNLCVSEMTFGKGPFNISKKH